MNIKFNDLTETIKRKEEHINICLEYNVQARSTSTGFSDVHLIHRALPEVSLEEVKTDITLFGHELAAPIIIEAMTGGTNKAARINEALAKSAEKSKIALGLGSQRVALEDSKLAYTFRIARETAPRTLLIGNIGSSQIMGEDGLKNVKNAITMINADAFAIHLNSLQEAIQPEGDTNFKGLTNKLRNIVSKVQVPIIVKETGAGIAFEEARLLESIGVKGIDVGGAGGTSWAAVESYRTNMRKDKSREKLANIFWDWGIPTTLSTIEVSQTTKLIVIASGGVRTGVDAIKAIALGADAVGMALPLLKPALEGTLNSVLQNFIDEFKTAMFLVGAESVKELKQLPLVITGRTAEWLRARGLNPDIFARRRNI